MDNLSSRRRMLIDDNIGEVQYSGTWYLDTYDQPGPLQWVGSTAKQTAHCLNSTGGFSFSFEGSSFSAQGQSNVVPSTTNSVLTCKVDGKDGNTPVVTADNINSWALCGGTGLGEDRHEVIVNITAGPDTVFCVDDIYYLSASNPNLQKKYSMFVPNAGEYRYTGVSWSNPFDKDGLLGRETYATGAKLIAPFYGESVELTAYLTSQMPRAAGRGNYSIDGGPGIPFVVPAWTPGFRGLPSNQSIFRVRLFATDPVAVGHHTLEVSNLGNSETAPLPIDYLYISYGDIDASSDTLGQSTRTSSTPSSTGTQTPPGAAGAGVSGKGSSWPLVGGAVGAALVLIVTAILIYILHARRKRARKAQAEARVTSDEAWNMAVPTRPFDTEQTPPAYSDVTYSYAAVPTDAPMEMTMSSTPVQPLGIIPPQKHRLGLFTAANAERSGPTSSNYSNQAPEADASSQSSPHLQGVTPSPPSPRKAPFQLPAKRK